MRLVIAGGGTGGHFFPGVAVAEEVLQRSKSSEVLFVGTARGIEARVCPREGYRLELIDVGGLKGGGVVGMAKGLLRVPRALLQSRAILTRFRPDLVVGVGGYASGPVCLVAALAGIPTAILEQNSVPGITNRILGRVVRAVFASFAESARFFPARRFQLIGNPIRAKLRAALADAASQKKDAAAQKTLLVLGGSQGARALNELVPAACGLLAAEGRRDFAVVHQTGTTERDAVEARYRDHGVNDASVRDFIEDMAAAYRDADLLVCRAGATTLAELTALGRASLLIPFPAAADDHQTMNARSLDSAGAAKLLPQATTTPRLLADAIATLLADDDARRRMAASARTLGRPEAAARIVDALAALANP